MDGVLCHLDRLIEACRRADVSHEERNNFLTKMPDEHSAPGSREQLRTLWSQWVKEQYPTQPEESANSGRMKNQVETPEAADEEETEGN